MVRLAAVVAGLEPFRRGGPGLFVFGIPLELDLDDEGNAARLALAGAIVSSEL